MSNSNNHDTNHDTNNEDPNQFMIDAYSEILGGNYEKAILALKQGIEKKFLAPNESLENIKLLQELMTLVLSVEISLRDNFGIEFNTLNKINHSEDTCSFCCKVKSKVLILVGGANGSICNYCVISIYNKLKEN